MRRRTVVTLLLCGLGALVTECAYAQVPSEAKPNRMEVVFCIDCSGSMTETMEPAKAKVAQILDDMVSSVPDADLRVGLIRYGDGIRRYQVFDLSADREQVCSQIYSTGIDARASTEFVGTFINKATQEIGWTPDASVAKRIYMVGNEVATQGFTSYPQAVAKAVAAGIQVNSVYCHQVFPNFRRDDGLSDRELATVLGVAPDWIDLADKGYGQFHLVLAPYRSNGFGAPSGIPAVSPQGYRPRVGPSMGGGMPSPVRTTTNGFMSGAPGAGMVGVTGAFPQRGTPTGMPSGPSRPMSSTVGRPATRR